MMLFIFHILNIFFSILIGMVSAPVGVFYFILVFLLLLALGSIEEPKDNNKKVQR